MMRFAGNWPSVIAHRGAGQFAPENTLAAMRRGLQFGCRAVEFDVMLSADGVAVLMHDPVFGRTVAGSGSVATTSARQLLAMDAGSWFSPAYAGEPVPLYAEVLQFCLAHGIWMDVEIKPAPGFEAATGIVVAELTEAGCQDPTRLSFSSFSSTALQAARATAPRWPRGLLVDAVPPDWQAQLEALECVALDCNHVALTAEQAGAVKAAGYGLLCYTVNTLERAQTLRSWGVDCVCTDRPDLLAGLAQAGPAEVSGAA